MVNRTDRNTSTFSSMGAAAAAASSRDVPHKGRGLHPSKAQTRAPNGPGLLISEIALAAQQSLPDSSLYADLNMFSPNAGSLGRGELQATAQKISQIPALGSLIPFLFDMHVRRISCQSRSRKALRGANLSRTISLQFRHIKGGPEKRLVLLCSHIYAQTSLIFLLR